MTSTIKQTQPARQVTTRTFAEWDLVQLTNTADLRFELFPHGGVHAIRCGELLVNQLLANPLEGGLNGLWLRVHEPGAVHSRRIAGAQPGQVAFGKHAARWSGTWNDLRYECVLALHPTEPFWTWRVQVRHHGEAPRRVDCLYGQDIGLAGTGALRSNEAYTCQYIDHQVYGHSEFGWTILSRQNQAQGKGVYPWLAQGCLSSAQSFCTDGFQFFGRSVKATNRPAALDRTTLPSKRLQYEFAYAGLQAAPVELKPDETHTFTFFAYLVEDHPEATSVEDLERLAPVARWAEETERAVDIGEPARDEPANLFLVSPVLSGEDLSDEDASRWVGHERRHEERLEGRLLSFFHGDANHVVLKAKELEVDRSHGHILRSGQSLFPNGQIMCSTNYMVGVFNAQVTLGNTNFHKLLSVVRNPLNLVKASGQRIFVQTGSTWSLLGLASAFEVSPGHARWIYKRHDGVIEVCVWADPESALIATELRVVEGEPRAFLISHEVVVGSGEFESAATVSIEPEAGCARFKPAKSELMAERYPDASFVLLTPSPERLAAMGGDELLYLAGAPRNLPYVVMQTKPVHDFRVVFVGDLHARSVVDGLCEHARDLSRDESVRQAARFWASLSGADELACGDDERVLALRDVTRWYAHNGMIHYTSPHGLEQYSGAAWGVRDVCQGPVEFLLALRRYGPIADILKEVFRHQYERKGDWPQWFMFDAYGDMQQHHAHGDIIVWPLKALCDYLEATEDASILRAEVPYTREEAPGFTDQARPLREHVAKLVDRIVCEFIPGTHLIRYGDGDWDDTLQPADQSMRTQMVSGWTVELVYQTFCRFEAVCKHLGEEDLAERMKSLTGPMRDDFNTHLVPGGVVAGFALFAEGGGVERVLLHPDDAVTGITYRLLPMQRGVLSEIFTPEQAAAHRGLIEEHLRFPDGVHLMDRPATYEGGVERRFRRAETASNFGREVGLQYVHAHLRYIETLAKLGHSDDLLQALLVVNPVGIARAVPNALPRQANAYFSSSDGDFADRYEALEQFGRLRDGSAKVKGGWRIYSSGPGIYFGLVYRNLLGIREYLGNVVLDPVLPVSLDGLRYRTELRGRKVQFVFRVRDGGAPSRITVNGVDLPVVVYQDNPYRRGGALIPHETWDGVMGDGINEIEVHA